MIAAILLAAGLFIAHAGCSKSSEHVIKTPGAEQMIAASGEPFWSITMYDKDYFFVSNGLNRYTLSARDAFVTNPDGSVDLYLQADSPGQAKEANWLPAPKAQFIPMMRLYWPKDTPPSIIDGTWKPPAVTVAP